MKKSLALLAALMLLLSCISLPAAHAEETEQDSGAKTAASFSDYARFFSDLLTAYNDVAKLDADAALLNDPVAQSIAAHWKKVYLDDYRLYVYGEDDPAELCPVMDAEELREEQKCK